MDSLGILDRSLAKHGQTVTITHPVSGQKASVTTARSFVRGYQPDELTDNITQQDRKAILSPTGLAFLPQKLDRIAIAGTTCIVQAADLIMDGDQVVRIECQVRG